jgi:hypothetical protein
MNALKRHRKTNVEASLRKKYLDLIKNANYSM